MLKFILLGLLAVVAIFAVVAALQPADFKITRTARLAAPAATVFPYFNDLHKWNDWSPWARMDPNAQNTFTGPESGLGAGFAWAGNNEVGEGNMTITESKPVELVRMRLEFIKPFAAVNTTEFIFKPEGEQTSVTWTMSGTNGFMGKAIGLLMNCDKMVGGQFEQGFENLRALVEPKQS